MLDVWYRSITFEAGESLVSANWRHQIECDGSQGEWCRVHVRCAVGDFPNDSGCPEVQRHRPREPLHRTLCGGEAWGLVTVLPSLAGRGEVKDAAVPNTERDRRRMKARIFLRGSEMFSENRQHSSIDESYL